MSDAPKDYTVEKEEEISLFDSLNDEEDNEWGEEETLTLADGEWDGKSKFTKNNGEIIE